MALAPRCGHVPLSASWHAHVTSLFQSPHRPDTGSSGPPFLPVICVSCLCSPGHRPPLAHQPCFRVLPHSWRFPALLSVTPASFKVKCHTPPPSLGLHQQGGVSLACGYPTSSWLLAPGSGGGWVLLAGCSEGHYPSPVPIRSKRLNSNLSVNAWIRRGLPCPCVFVVSDLLHLQGPGRVLFPGARPPWSAPGDPSAPSCVRQLVGIGVGVRSEKSKSCQGVGRENTLW